MEIAGVYFDVFHTSAYDTMRIVWHHWWDWWWLLVVVSVPLSVGFALGVGASQRDR